MRERADVGADGEGDAGGDLLFEFGDFVVEHGVLARGLVGLSRVVREVFEDGEGGDGEECASRSSGAWSRR